MEHGTLTVLLVDDDADNANRFRRMAELQSAPGFDLLHADSHGAAIDLLALRRCDVILLNLSACGPAPLAVLAVISSHAAGSPVVVLAREAHEGVALKALQQGAADHLLLEQVFEALLARTVRHAVERHRAEWQRRRAEEALRLSERRYRALFEQSHDAILLMDPALRIVEANPAASSLLGHDTAHLCSLGLGDLHADLSEGMAVEATLGRDGAAPEIEVRLRRSDGDVACCLLSAAARLDEDGTVRGYQAILHDITERKRVEQQLIHDAFHDALTGLPNRSLFADRLDGALARWRRQPSQLLAVIFLDLDRFKVVNDSLGHSVGDGFLRQIAVALRASVREEDTVARLGGDESAILVESLQDEADAVRAAERIQHTFAGSFDIAGHRVFTSASIGIALPAASADSVDDLLRNADNAMYRAKRQGTGGYEVFAPTMREAAVDLLQLETDLRLAVDRDEFVMHYQPIVDVAQRKVVGLEALARWHHPTRGLLMPHSFIPLAEESGVIVALGVLTLRQACLHAAALARRVDGADAPYVAVNISGKHLVLRSFHDHVADALAESGLRPELLALEITESVLITNAAAASDSLRRLRELGVRICIDDFGTGYSSLSYLHALPVDGIKVDRSFISSLEAGTDRMEVVQAIADLGRRLGMSVVAEGVETRAQLLQVEQLGVTVAQGFLFSPAQPPSTEFSTDGLWRRVPRRRAVKKTAADYRPSD